MILILRINENFKIQRGDLQKNLKKYAGKNTAFDAYNISAEKEYHFEIQTKNDSTWFLMMPLKSSNETNQYQKKIFKTKNHLDLMRKRCEKSVYKSCSLRFLLP